MVKWMCVIRVNKTFQIGKWTSFAIEKIEQLPGDRCKIFVANWIKIDNYPVEN